MTAMERRRILIVDDESDLRTMLSSYLGAEGFDVAEAIDGNQALEQMHKVQAATGDAWIDLVRGADEAWAKMREAFEKARSHFHK